MSMAIQDADPCPACGKDLVRLKMLVDGNNLVMTSCANCDIRQWSRAGRQIDLGEALVEVGEHAGRRR